MCELVSIITVTYNSEKTIAKTMESIRSQTYKNIEYIIVDGKSSDCTMEIVEGFRLQLETAGIRLHTISEPDTGIYDAMNKGIRLATGEIIGIINSDDWYEEDTLETVVKTFDTEKCDLMFSDIRMHKRDGRTFVKKARLRKFQTSRDWNHPTMFVKACVYQKYPFRMKGLHDDYGCYLQMRRAGCKVVTVDKVLANFRMGGVSNRKSFQEALRRITDRYKWCYRVNGYSRFYIIECIMIEMAKWILG